MKNSADKQDMLNCFMEMVGESTDRAQQYLQASNWQLEEAIQLFNAHNHGQGEAHGTMVSSFTERRFSPSPPATQNKQNDSAGDSVQQPSTVKRKSMADPDPLISYMENGSMDSPNKRQRKIYKVPGAESSQEVRRQSLLPLPEEPQDDKGLNICRVCVRFPNGQRVQRRFLQSDPIQLLWSFCCFQVPEAANGRLFRLSYIVPGASHTLDYCRRNVSFGDAGVSNSLISMIWE